MLITTTQLADKLGMNYKTVDYYIRTGLFPPPRHTLARRRYYYLDDVEALRGIHEQKRRTNKEEDG